MLHFNPEVRFHPVLGFSVAVEVYDALGYDVWIFVRERRRALRRGEGRPCPSSLCFIKSDTALDPFIELRGDNPTVEDVHAKLVDHIESARWAAARRPTESIEAQLGELVVAPARVTRRHAMLDAMARENSAL